MSALHLGSDRVRRSHVAHVAHLRQCARAWDKLGHPDQGDRVRKKADQLDEDCAVCAKGDRQ